MLSYVSKRRRFRRSLLTTSAVVALSACGAHLAWAQDATKSSTAASSGSNDGASQSSNAVDEVVVTGTNIKGVKPIAPVITITRQDIDESGYSTIGDVMRSLPEDFAGGQNPGTFNGQGGVNSQNISDGSTVNLRGLGSDATLTLINGHRLPGDGFYEAGDISVIPLGAIERVEIVTDGSSAIYGSDAVAGVVNFILRKDYQGLETSARVGGATDGGGTQQIYSLLGGVVKDNWHVLIGAEYERQEDITASERSFTSGAYGPTTLMQPETSRSILLSGGDNITDKISLSVDAIYSDRESGGLTGTTGSYAYQTEFDTPNYNVATTLDFKLPRNWNLRLVGTDASSSNSENEQYGVGSLSNSISVKYRNDVSSLELAADGTAINLPSGELRLAVGGGVRHEGFEESTTKPYIEASRDVSYAYGEALIPLVPISTERLGLNELEISASGRYEHYSDLGDTANPKVAIRYVPIAGLSIIGSWGTSFKAPSFAQLYAPSEVYYFPIADLGGQGAGTGLLTSGGNPKLKPEQSKNWNIGAEYKPPNMRSLIISITYFNIDYTDRIVQPITPSYPAALSNAVNAPFVELSPSSSLQQSTIAAAEEFINEVGSAYNASTVKAIVQDNYQNALSQVDTGVDIAYRDSFPIGNGAIKTFANATWNHLTQQISADAPDQLLSGKIFNVPSFRARGGVTWSSHGLNATVTLNYTSSEADTGVTPNQHVASLSTVDTNISYRFPENRGFSQGLSVILSATNLFDRPPPYVYSAGLTYRGLHYDSLNASPIGRFVSLEVAKKW